MEYNKYTPVLVSLGGILRGKRKVHRTIIVFHLSSFQHHCQITITHSGPLRVQYGNEELFEFRFSKGVWSQFGCSGPKESNLGRTFS